MCTVEKKKPQDPMVSGIHNNKDNGVLDGEANSASLESESRLSQILHGLSIAAFVIDRHHVLTHCNKAFETLTNLSAASVVGTNQQWRTFYPHERPTLADFIVDGASEEEISRYYKGKYKKSGLIDGAYEVEDFFPNLSEGGKWLFFTAAPLVDEAGRITGAIETLQDISDRKKTEERLRKSERRLRALLDFEPYPVVVFNLDGLVSYVNPAFSETFGWRLDELEGKRIPFVPTGLEEETRAGIRRLMEERVVLHFETQRLTKDGHTLDVVIRAAVFAESKNEPAGIILILRDVTEEKRIARSNEAMIRITMALPEYPDLEELLTYINHEVKRLLGTEGAIAVLHDEIRGDLFVLGAAYDDTDTERRIEESRFSMDQLVAGRVIRTGEPIIVPDTSEERAIHEERDRRLGYKTRNLLIVPLKSSERVIGALCAINKKGRPFAETDSELLNMIAGTVALSVENARFAEDLKKAYRNNDALLRISMALPKHPELEDLLDYVNEEVKRLLNAEGSVALLLDEEKNEFYVLGAAYDALDTQKRVKEVRFPVDQLIAGKVVRTGQPLIVSDTSLETHLHEERDRKLGYKTRNLVLAPLRSRERIIGVISAINKKDGSFTEKDLELLSLIAGTVALSIENAKFSEEIKKAYREVSSLNRAKDKAINHLSHELKTPVSILTSSFNLLGKRLGDLQEQSWKPTTERIKRNLLRILDIQYEVDDIMENRKAKAYDLLHLLLEQCADQLMTLVAEQCGEGPIVERIAARIDELFGPKVSVPEVVDLGQTLEERLGYLKPFFPHREVDIVTRIEPVPPVYIPREVLHKVLDGLIKNAVENTPDEGRIELAVIRKGAGSLFLIRDYGVGIPEEAQKRIFEGFFSTRDTMAYSSKRPFDFNAGGKGADLLRMKIFSERHHFQIDMASTRCRHLPTEAEVCPGRISACTLCSTVEDCHQSGGTIFSLYFPPVPSEPPDSTQG
jgi:PAS domain S-box-containing protein